MRNLKRLAYPAYILAVVLVSFPLLDMLGAVWPLEPGEVVWRFSAVGVLNRVVLTPLLGVLIAMAAAVLLEHGAVLRTLAVLCAMACVGFMGALSIFVLDASEMQVLIAPEATEQFRMGALTTAARSVLALVGFGTLSVGGWRAASGTGGRSAKEKPGLVLDTGS